ncbi:MAG: hypothetical protein IJ072_01330 [Oscillospiraceae bacterium]|nr:hypothetical protein [Oscillospiraceae bacterium]
MRKIKGIFALALCLALTLGLCVTALAADTGVSYEGQEKGFVFSGKNLFEDFTSVMPGDVHEQKITVTNNSTDSDYAKIYLRAEATEDETMTALLKELSLTVKNGDEVIYDSTADQTAGLTENVLLGNLHTGESVALTATLTVPIELDNKFADARGDVDWIFTAEERNENPHMTVEVKPTS